MKTDRQPELRPVIIEPQDIEFIFERVRYIFSQGEIDEERYKIMMHLLMAGDIEGRVWTIGTETGKWYRKDGDKWVQEDPPPKLIWGIPEEEMKKLEADDAEILRLVEETRVEPVVQADADITSEPATKFCIECGGELPKEARFCPVCGKPSG